MNTNPNKHRPKTSLLIQFVATSMIFSTIAACSKHSESSASAKPSLPAPIVAEDPATIHEQPTPLAPHAEESPSDVIEFESSSSNPNFDRLVTAHLDMSRALKAQGNIQEMNKHTSAAFQIC
jgi:hypothetical protein